MRAREDVRADLMRARHRLSKLLLRHGLVYNGGKAWTAAHHQWLAGHHFEQIGLRLAYDEALDSPTPDPGRTASSTAPNPQATGLRRVRRWRHRVGPGARRGPGYGPAGFGRSGAGQGAVTDRPIAGTGRVRPDQAPSWTSGVCRFAERVMASSSRHHLQAHHGTRRTSEGRRSSTAGGRPICLDAPAQSVGADPPGTAAPVPSSAARRVAAGRSGQLSGRAVDSRASAECTGSRPPFGNRVP